jgi:hypothetical protein
MRLLVCGSRAWTDEHRIRGEIAALAPSEIIHGAAPGADTIAVFVSTMWACTEGRALVVAPYPALWERDGRAAGPLRNARMLADGKPDRGLAFGALWKRGDEERSRTLEQQEAVELMRNNWTVAQRLRRDIADLRKWKRTGTGDMVHRMLRASLPVRWIEAPNAVAVDLDKMPAPPSVTQP